MKLKQAPGDFRVEEVSALVPGNEGPFTLYRLEKSGIGTLEALQVLARAWRLRGRAVAFAGLKDKYGVTAQTISVRGGPTRNFEGRGVRANYLGRSPRPVARGTLLGNRFRIVLRHLAPGQAASVEERARAAATHGFPDYYDDQRFGSMRGEGGGLVARALLRGQEEEALRLAIATPAREDRSRLKRRRRLLRDRWGAWGELAHALERSLEQRICEALAGGATFGEATQLLDQGLRSLYLSAYQAYLFNEGLRRAVGSGPSHPGVAGPYVFFEQDPGALKAERIPLASADAEPHPLLDDLLAAEGVDRAALGRLRFRRGIRAAIVVPEELETGGVEQDECNPGRVKLALSFRLKPGSYATMLVKRCTFDFRGPGAGLTAARGSGAPF
ncbi:MAG: tRNA pseudouridine(13) synthase TruD [Planctomycetaceae bacterium]